MKLTFLWFGWSFFSRHTFNITWHSAVCIDIYSKHIADPKQLLRYSKKKQKGKLKASIHVYYILTIVRNRIRLFQTRIDNKLQIKYIKMISIKATNPKQSRKNIPYYVILLCKNKYANFATSHFDPFKLKCLCVFWPNNWTVFG